MPLSPPSGSRMVSVIPDISLRSVCRLSLSFLEAPGNYKPIFCLYRFSPLGQLGETDTPGPESHLCVAVWTHHIIHPGANCLFGMFPCSGDYLQCHLALPRMCQVSDSYLCGNRKCEYTLTVLPLSESPREGGLFLCFSFHCLSPAILSDLLVNSQHGLLAIDWQAGTPGYEFEF